MSKFAWSLAVLFILCLGLGVVGTLLPPSTRAHGDPMMTRVAWCTDKYARTPQPLDDVGKSEILRWCIRETYGSTR
jgi:hypothetical protein